MSDSEQKWCDCSEWHLPHRHMGATLITDQGEVAANVVLTGAPKTSVSSGVALPPLVRAGRSRRTR